MKFTSINQFKQYLINEGHMSFDGGSVDTTTTENLPQFTITGYEWADEHEEQENPIELSGKTLLQILMTNLSVSNDADDFIDKVATHITTSGANKLSAEDELKLMTWYMEQQGEETESTKGTMSNTVEYWNQYAETDENTPTLYEPTNYTTLEEALAKGLNAWNLEADVNISALSPATINEITGYFQEVGSINSEIVNAMISQLNTDTEDIKDTTDTKYKRFEDVQVGDKGKDYNGEIGTVKAKGFFDEMQDWFTRGQMAYSDMKEMGIDDDTLCVAVLPEDDEVSFDSPKGSTFVYTYGPEGFVVYK